MTLTSAAAETAALAFVPLADEFVPEGVVSAAPFMARALPGCARLCPEFGHK